MQMPQTSIKNTGSFVVVIKRVKIQFEKKSTNFILKIYTINYKILLTCITMAKIKLNIKCRQEELELSDFAGGNVKLQQFGKV